MTLIVLGFGGFCGARRVTNIETYLSEKSHEKALLILAHETENPPVHTSVRMKRMNHIAM